MGLLTNDNTAVFGLDVWNLPIGWPQRLPISATFMDFQSTSSNSEILAGNWQIITLERRENEFMVNVNGESTLVLTTHSHVNQVTNQSMIYIGGAPQGLIDNLDFLQEMHPQVKKTWQISCFHGCIGDIYLLDSQVLLTNASKMQNIDVC